MQNYSFDIYVDVSGQPKSNQFFGSIAINSSYWHNFEKDFNKRFPKLLRSKVKGKNLGYKKLLKIIEFFDEHKAIFTSTPIRLQDWSCYKTDYSSKSFWVEKIYGLTYFKLLQRTTKSSKSIKYNAILCEDNQLDTKKARGYLRQFLKESNRNVNLLSSIPRDTNQLKLADFVASAHKKVGYNTLMGCSGYKRCPPIIPKHLLNRIFTDRSSVKK